MKKALFILLALPLMAFGQSFDESENLRVVGTIYYERNVFETTVEEQEVLQDILLKMQVDNQMRVYIVGFCDRWGGVEVNDKFSYARAIYIANWLRSHGIQDEQISYVGEGIDTNAESDAMARRVEILREIEPAREIPPVTLGIPEPIKPKVAEAAPMAPKRATQTQGSIAHDQTPAPAHWLDNLSLRTNLLYLVGGMFNLGAEYKSESSSFGYLLNLGYSPFGGDCWEHSFGGWFVSPELRYYIPAAERWFVGVQMLYGGYNFKLADTGYQGNVLGGGLTGGYKITINERFDMDFNVGLGYGSYIYDTYYHSDGINIRQERDLKNGTLLPQAGVNLIWKIR